MLRKYWQSEIQIQWQLTSRQHANTENGIKRQVEPEVAVCLCISYRGIISEECLGFAVFSNCSLGLHSRLCSFSPLQFKQREVLCCEPLQEEKKGNPTAGRAPNEVLVRAPPFNLLISKLCAMAFVSEAWQSSFLCSAPPPAVLGGCSHDAPRSFELEKWACCSSLVSAHWESARLLQNCSFSESWLFSFFLFYRAEDKLCLIRWKQ